MTRRPERAPVDPRFTGPALPRRDAGISPNRELETELGRRRRLSQRARLFLCLILNAAARHTHCSVVVVWWEGVLGRTLQALANRPSSWRRPSRRSGTSQRQYLPLRIQIHPALDRMIGI